jgi:hypothetical protein
MMPRTPVPSLAPGSTGRHRKDGLALLRPILLQDPSTLPQRYLGLRPSSAGRPVGPPPQSRNDQRPLHAGRCCCPVSQGAFHRLRLGRLLKRSSALQAPEQIAEAPPTAEGPGEVVGQHRGLAPRPILRVGWERRQVGYQLRLATKSPAEAGLSVYQANPVTLPASAWLGKPVPARADVGHIRGPEEPRRRG